MGRMMNTFKITLLIRICLLICFVVPVVSFTHLQAVSAQESQPEISQTADVDSVIPEREIPGDTTVLLIAAAGLVFIAAGAVILSSRKRSPTL